MNGHSYPIYVLKMKSTELKEAPFDFKEGGRWTFSKNKNNFGPYTIKRVFWRVAIGKLTLRVDLILWECG